MERSKGAYRRLAAELSKWTKAEAEINLRLREDKLLLLGVHLKQDQVMKEMEALSAGFEVYYDCERIDE